MLAGHSPTDLGRVDGQEERAIRQESTHRREVQVEHALEPELAPHALIRDGRVDVAVADDGRAPLERRPDHLVDMLRARRRVEERLGPRADVAAVENQVTKLLSQLRPARLTRRHDLAYVQLETRSQELRLRRLARAVEALEGDEHRPASYGRP